MNFLDIILLLLLVYGLIQGIRHGFVKELSSFIAIIISIYAAKFWSDDLAVIITSIVEIKDKIAVIISYIFIFIVKEERECSLQK